MSFSFHFSGDDIEGDSNEDFERSSKREAADFELHKSQSLISPKQHTLQDLLTDLPSQISYNYLTITPQTATSTPTDVTSTSAQTPSQHGVLNIARRAIFDINAQLMAEADPTSPDADTGVLLQGLNTGDLTTGIYEGGFKTWECAIDLAALLASRLDEFLTAHEQVRVIELGAGSGVPGLVFLREALRRAPRTPGQALRRGCVKVTLCDYNYDVLRLGTAANVLLACALDGESSEPKAVEAETDLELEDVDHALVQKCLGRLDDAGIEVDFVSGAWGEEFVKLLDVGRMQEKLLLLASETIYSPDSLGIFATTLLETLRLNQSDNSGTCATAWVAAKKVYFGVGGGIAEFEQEIQKQGGTSRRILDVGGSEAGVGRVVLEVRGTT